MTQAHAKRADSPLGATPRRARERARLGMRELAGLLEVSPATSSDLDAPPRMALAYVAAGRWVEIRARGGSR